MRVFVITTLGIMIGALLGCQRPASVDDIPARPLPAPGPPLASRAPGVLDASASEASPDAAAPPAPAPCFVANRAERRDLHNCEVDAPPEPNWDVTSSLEVTVSPAEVKTTPGGIGDLVIHYANRTDAPVILVFDDSATRGHVVAHHPGGRRADGVEAPPPWSTPKRRLSRITLGPKAVLDERKMWFASSWKWAPNSHEKQWPRTLLAPLPKGTYTLRVRTRLVARAEGDRIDFVEPSTTGRIE